MHSLPLCGILYKKESKRKTISFAVNVLCKFFLISKINQFQFSWPYLYCIIYFLLFDLHSSHESSIRKYSHRVFFFQVQLQWTSTLLILSFSFLFFLFFFFFNLSCKELDTSISEFHLKKKICRELDFSNIEFHMVFYIQKIHISPGHQGKTHMEHDIGKILSSTQSSIFTISSSKRVVHY